MNPDLSSASKRMSRTVGFDNPRERELRSAVHRSGLRFRIHVRIPGTRRTIDFAFTRVRLAVFSDGCFWHGCPVHGTVSKTNTEWWTAKITANVERDKDTDARLHDLGWHVLRIWEHAPIADAASQIIESYQKLKSKQEEVEKQARALPGTGGCVISHASETNHGHRV